MSSAERRNDRGFTLVEVMVALVLAGILASVIFQVVRGQARFAVVQTAQQEVQQNARGAIEIIASDLRGVQPAGLIDTSPTAVTFMLPRAWGISCGGAGGTTVPALFPAVSDEGVMYAIDGDAGSGMLADTSAAGSGLWAPTPTSTATFAGYAKVTSIPDQNPALGAAGNACSAIRSTAPAAGLIKAVTITGTGLPKTTAGNVLYLYQLVRYDVSTSSAGASDEYWIRRSNGMPNSSGSTQQPLAGPLSSATGLTFTYYKADGTEFTPGSTRADLVQVARIGVKVVARSRTRGRANLTDSMSTSVLLRNN